MQQHRINVSSTSDIVTARLEGREVAIRMGFGSFAVTIIAAAISKIARHIVHQKKRGEIVFDEVKEGEKSGLVITAHTEGSAPAENAKTNSNPIVSADAIEASVGSLQGMMDEVKMVSPEPGHTTVIMKRWR